MKVRSKIVLVVLPVLISTITLVGVSSFFAATRGITRVTENFLQFKARQLEQYAQGQWSLLLENELADRSDMRRAAQRGIESYARSIIERETELILAAGRDGSPVMATESIETSDEDHERLAALADEDSRDLIEISLGEVERVASGFWFEPFELFYLVSEDRATFFGDVDRMARQTALVLAIAVLAGVVVLLMLSAYLTRPLQRVVGAMTSIISTGDLGSRVEIQYRDEIGTLSHTFNLMIDELQRAYDQIKSYAFDAALAQKKEQGIRNIFQKYVPQDLISRFFENPEQMLVGDNRRLAILFSDIRGFTGISESMPPDEMVHSLNRYFSYMVDVIMEQGGIVDKYIGDAIMAFFGAPVSSGDEPDRAIAAVLGMIEALDRFNAEQVEANKPPFRIGIGLAFGEVTVGNIGTDRKMDYTVIGDTANLASRLEGLTKHYGVPILVTENIRMMVQRELPWRLVDMVAVKGRRHGARLYTTMPGISDTRRELWQLHNQAMQRYYALEFAEAAAQFNRIMREDPADELAALMVKRAETLARTPPDESWTGIEVMESK